MRNRSAQPGEELTGEESRAKPPKRRHWWRWILGSLAGLLVLAIVATAAAVELAPGAEPLALPEHAAAPSGPLDGTWQVSPGSVAGFRVRETVIGFSNEVTGRTGHVTGMVLLAGARIVRATVRVSLDTIMVNGKAHPAQLIKSLDTTDHPLATVTLTRPVALPAAFSSGAVITQTTTATLTLNGTARPVPVKLSARRDGTVIEAAGSLPVAFPEFHITGPRGYGVFGSLASNGTAEFLLILRPGAGG